MCYECWEEYGRPSDVTGDVVAAADAVRDLYTETFVGGALHIVTDDWNLEDEHLDWCAANGAGPDQMTVFEQQALDCLRPLSIKHRATALALANGYFDPCHQLSGLANR